MNQPTLSTINDERPIYTVDDCCDTESPEYVRIKHRLTNLLAEARKKYGTPFAEVTLQIDGHDVTSHAVNDFVIATDAHLNGQHTEEDVYRTLNASLNAHAYQASQTIIRSAHVS